jgi:5-formyltetrahydrofolate cyclo-ligase
VFHASEQVPLIDTLRKLLTSKRQEFFLQASSEVFTRLHHFATECLPSKPSRIACYYSVGAECPTHELIEIAWKQGHQIFLPRLHPTQDRQMIFSPYSTETFLVPNRYGIMEPTASSADCIPDDLDLMIIPILGFNVDGYRMGMGKGYYDTAIGNTRVEKRPRRVGLAFSCQACAFIPQPWDLQCNQIVTEQKIISFF